MKVLLVSINTYNFKIVYPLGISVLAKVLSDAGYNTKQFDFLASNNSYEKFINVLKEYNPDIVAISIRNFLNTDIKIVKKFVEIINLAKPNIKVVLGGSGFAMDPDVILKTTKANYGFVGQAESGFVEFIQNVFSNNQKETIFYSLNDKGIEGPLYDKDILNFYKKYPLAIGLYTKRGCKYRCLYCKYKIFDGKGIKYRKTADVISDMKFLIKQGVTDIFFTDSVFNDENNKYIDLLKELIKEKIKLNWSAHISPKFLNKKNVILMQKAGLTLADVGIDASTDETLIGMQKDFTWQEAEKALKLLNKYNIYTIVHIIFGGPKETEETLKRGIKNIINLKPYVSDFNIKIFFGREKYNPELSTEFIEQSLNNAFGKGVWSVPMPVLI